MSMNVLDTFGFHEYDVQRVMDDCMSALESVADFLRKCKENDSVETIEELCNNFESEITNDFNVLQRELSNQQRYIPFQRVCEYLQALMIYETTDTLNRVQLFSDADLNKFGYFSLIPAEVGIENFVNEIVANGEYVGVMNYIDSRYDIAGPKDSFGSFAERITEDVREYYVTYLSKEYAFDDDKLTSDDYEEAFWEHLENGNLTFTDLAEAYKDGDVRKDLGNQLKDDIDKENESHQNTYWTK